MRLTLFPALTLAAMALSACVTTDMQGYADRQLPQHPVQRIVALVAAPGPLGSNLQSSIQQEAHRHGVVAEDALNVFPPTRTYSNAEVKAELARDGVDAVLVLTVGDTGIQREYAGTVFYSTGTATTNAIGAASTFGNLRMRLLWQPPQAKQRQWRHQDTATADRRISKLS